MKYLLPIFCVILASCQLNQETEKPSEKWLTEYSEHTQRTDPGEYGSLYGDLPASLDSLCSIIKCQLLHPVEAREMGMVLEEVYIDGQTPTTQDLLEHCCLRDSFGFQDCREQEDRIVVACYHHAMLLASILRSKGIPVRMRAGFSRYYEKQFKIRFGHVICEVWDENANRWIIVDPDRQIVDMDKDGFDFACQAWENVRKNKIDLEIYTSSVGVGIKGIINLLALDASLLLREEKQYWNYANIVLDDIGELADLDGDIIEILDELAHNCSHADQNMDKISEIYYQHTYLKPSGQDYDTYLQLVFGE
ncbi:transglutaminase-like domain-containing protein [Bacteroidota bacterium]